MRETGERDRESKGNENKEIFIMGLFLMESFISWSEWEAVRVRGLPACLLTTWSDSNRNVLQYVRLNK